MTWIDAFAHATDDEIPEPLIRRHPGETPPAGAKAIGLTSKRGNDGPLVSVVVPTFRDAGYLQDALHSVGAQTHQNVELVVVDSSDVEWIEAIAAECEWIRHIVTAPIGVAAARNEGISRANGDFIALLDADDFWHPEKLERQLRGLSPDATASYTSHYFVKFWGNETPQVKLRNRAPPEGSSAARAALTGAIYPHTSTLLFNKSAVSPRPFVQGIRNFEDRLFAVELFRDHPPAFVEEPMAVRRLREGSLTDQQSRRVKTKHRLDAYDYVAQHYPDFRHIARGRIAEECFSQGCHELEANNAALARDYFTQCLVHSPAHVGALAMYLGSLVPRAMRSGIWSGVQALLRTRDRIRSGGDAGNREVEITESVPNP